MTGKLAGDEYRCYNVTTVDPYRDESYLPGSDKRGHAHILSDMSGDTLLFLPSNLVRLNMTRKSPQMTSIN